MESPPEPAGFPSPPPLAMTRRRLQRLALSTLLGLALAVGGVRLADALGPRDGAAPVQTASDGVLYDESFSVREGGSLTVDLGAEDVVVRTVDGTRARVRVEGQGRDAAEVFERKRFSARAASGDLDVRTTPPSGPWSMGRQRASFTVTVEVPRRFDVAVDLGSGDLRVGTVTGDVDVDTGSGGVRIERADGTEIAIDTGSGDVQAGALRGRVEIDTGSGSVRVDRVEGPLAVDTGSGDVAVDEAVGPVEAGTGSGSLNVGLASARDAAVETGSGDATVRLASRTGWTLDLDGGAVEIDRALGFQGRQDRRRARGTVGGGGAQLSVDTGSGEIRVLRR